VTVPTKPGDVARYSLTVTPRSARSEIVVGRGVLGQLPALLAQHAAASRYVVISDETVAGLHGRRVVETMDAAGLAVTLLTFPPGEAHKTVTGWATLVEGLADAAPGRDGGVVAVGGGVTGDMAGFAAAAFARGILLVQVPTTLLAMVDAAIGGKTGVDLAAGKNLSGAWHPARLIVIDPSTLDTLPIAILAQGFAEAVKHGAIADAAYFDRIAGSAATLGAREPQAIDHLIRTSVQIKTAIVERDPFEGGERATLNFGHTLGHAIERATDYSIPHGDAVAMGMVAEARVGEHLGVTAPGTARRLTDALAALGLPTGPPPDLDGRAVLAATRADKKSRRGAPRYALLADIGTMARAEGDGWTHAVSDDVVLAVFPALHGSGTAVHRGP